MTDDKHKGIGVLFTKIGNNIERMSGIKPLVEKYFNSIETDNVEEGIKELLNLGFSTVTIFDLDEDQTIKVIESLSEPMLVQKLMSVDKTVKTIGYITFKMLFNAMRNRMSDDEKQLYANFTPKEQGENKESISLSITSDNVKQVKELPPEDKKNNKIQEPVVNEEKVVLRYNVKDKTLYIGNHVIEVVNYITETSKEVADLLKKHYGFKETKRCNKTI